MPHLKMYGRNDHNCMHAIACTINIITHTTVANAYSNNRSGLQLGPGFQKTAKLYLFICLFFIIIIIIIIFWQIQS